MKLHGKTLLAHRWQKKKGGGQETPLYVAVKSILPFWKTDIN